MRKRGKKLLAIMLAASMTLGQGSTWTLAQENVAQAIEGAAVSAQTDGEAIVLDEEGGDTGGFGDGTDGGGEDGSGGETTDPSQNDTETPGGGDDTPSGDSSAEGDDTGDDSGNGDDGNIIPGDNENGDQGIINDGDNVDQDGDAGEKKDEIFTSPDNNKINDDSRVLTTQLTVNDGTNSVWGSGILTGSGEMDAISWDPENDTNRGYDGALDNAVIRSFDSITYNVGVTFTTNNAAHTLVYEITLPDDNELSLDEDTMHASNISMTQNEGGTKTYKCIYSLEADYIR